MPMQTRDGISFLPVCLHTRVCVCVKKQGLSQREAIIRWTSVLNLAHSWRPHLETGATEVDCLDPQAKGPTEASAQDSSADLAGKAPRLLGQAAEGCGNSKLPGCGLDQDTWNCGSYEARASEGLWIWGDDTGLGRLGGEKGWLWARRWERWVCGLWTNGSGHRTPSRPS